MIQLLTLRIELEKIFPETNADFGYKFAGFFQSSKNAEAAKTIKNVLYGNADTSTLDKYQTTLHEKSFEEKIYKPCSELYREKFPEPIIKNPQAIKSSG